ncbi:hypothetical protein [Citricoccus alkalitolerans]|uniref:Uncharacterized protein n=1 Tax=Citricoccus alkalitolerans TaxID=246603 RepID=A0ABV8XU64_9MICC
MKRTAQSMPRNNARPVDAAKESASGFRVKWDRTIIAAVAVLAALTFLGTGIAAAFGAGTLLVSGIAAAVAVAGVATLRTLALRDRKKRKDRRIESAFDEAMNPGLPTSERTVPTTGPTRVFDAAAGSTSGRGAATAPAEKAVSAPSTEQTAPEQVTRDAGADESASALPSVPRPTYLDAAEAHRVAPAPIAKPEAPQASPGVKLKAGVSAEYRAKVEATANRTLDLDKVLERRRAV